MSSSRSASASVLYDAPGPRARTRYRAFGALAVLGIAGLLWYAYYKLDSTGQFAPSCGSRSSTRPCSSGSWTDCWPPSRPSPWPPSCRCCWARCWPAGRLSDHKPVRTVSTAVVQFFRAMPLLIMIFALYRGLFAGDPFWALVTGLTLYNGSVQAEIIRSGIEAVPRGQSEAAYALGMSKSQVMLSILVPQAVRSMLPAIISQMVVTLKDTSLGFVITYPELLYAIKIIASNSTGYPYVPTVLVATPIYIAMCLLLTALARWIEARGRRGANRRTPVPA